MTERDREYHDAHTDSRNAEARMVRAVVREGERVHAKWQRNIAAAVNVPEPVEDPDFPGCVW